MIERREWTESETRNSLERLAEWGVEGVRFLDQTTGELRMAEYARYLREKFGREGGLGELNIPPLLRELVDTQTKIGLFSAPMGFGHHRLSRYFELLLKTLEIEAIHIDLGKPNGELPAIMEFFAYLKTAYINGSQRTAVNVGLAEGEDWLDYGKKNLVTLGLKIWEKRAPEHFYNTVMGKPGKHLTPQNTRRVFRTLDQVFGRELRRYVRSKGVTHSLVLYPMVNALLKKGRSVLVGTDSVLEPAGWIPEPCLLVETRIAKEKLLAAWASEYENQIEVTGGFPAPIGGLIQVEHLIQERAERLLQGEPLTLVLPASGVATAQLKSFQDILVETAPQVAAGQLRILIQTGAERLGKKVWGRLATTVAELESEYPGMEKGVILHYGQTVEAALDIFEILAASSLPMALAVKGSEMSRVAVQLGIPHLATGTIGEHEKWNVILAALQESEVATLPSAFYECWLLADSNDFPKEERGLARASLEHSYCHDIETGVRWAREAVLRKTVPAVNRQMMPESLVRLLR